MTDEKLQLARFLEEIRSLATSYPALTHSWRFAGSAVWAMRRYQSLAEKVAYQVPATEAVYIADTGHNLEQLTIGHEPSLDWERGFWYNAAIMRLDALWERLF